MRVLVRRTEIAVIPDDAEWTRTDSPFVAWQGHTFLASRSGGALILRHIGPDMSLAEQPINVTSRHIDRGIRLISNFAETPFEFGAQQYASVEGFWQSLRASTAVERSRIAGLKGSEAKRAGAALSAPDTIDLDGRTIRWGSPEHWDLMRQACRAKFSQCVAARHALLGTAPRPLVHRVRFDSRSIPGAVMADIWMGLRTEFGILERQQRADND
jgi:hypothetical protein